MADSLVTANPVLTEVDAPEMNMLDMAVKGGWIIIVLGVLSVICFYVLFERNYMIRKAGKEDSMFMERIRDYIRSREIKMAINYYRAANTPSACVVEKRVSRLERPINDAQVIIGNASNIEVAKLEKGLTVIATISGGVPMLGLLGTVIGMVRTFYETADVRSGNIDITSLSGGIYEAMTTTVGGLTVGIIAMFAYNYLVMLVDRVINKMGSHTTELMDLLNEPTKQLAGGIKKKKQSIAQFQHGLHDGRHLPVTDIFYDNLYGGITQCHKGIVASRQTTDFGQTADKSGHR